MASKLLLIVVFLFDVGAFGLSIAAERRRSGAVIIEDSEQNYKYYVYNSDIYTAYDYGIGAMLLLFASHVLLMIVSKSFCIRKALKSVGSRARAIILLIICWVVFVFTHICLLLLSSVLMNRLLVRG